MNFLDGPIVSAANSFSQASQSFNLWMSFISENDLFKGVPTMGLFWWAWFSDKERRKTLVITLAGAFLALFLGRAMQVGMPFRARPMHEPSISFQMPVGVEKKMEEWSSFPSDHAALFYSMAMGFFLVSRPVGIAAFLYYTVVMASPRVYLGLHYPTDLLAGALLGMACVLVFYPSRERLGGAILGLSERFPGLFYCFLFALTFELGTLFDSIRELGSFVVKGKL